MPDLWKAWDELLPKETNRTYLSRGYFGPPSTDVHFKWNSYKILICHSLGIHIAPIHTIKESDLIVIFGGFKTFHPADGFKSKLSKKIINVMLNELKRNPKNMIQTFYSNCDLKAPQTIDYIDIEQLKIDLELLDTNELNLDIFKNTSKVILFHGDQDKIVPPERAEALNKSLEKSELIMVDKAGHGLPFTHSEICMDAIFGAFEKKNLNNKNWVL